MPITPVHGGDASPILGREVCSRRADRVPRVARTLITSRATPVRDSFAIARLANGQISVRPARIARTPNEFQPAAKAAAVCNLFTARFVVESIDVNRASHFYKNH
jgi:hypothetical protein